MYTNVKIGSVLKILTISRDRETIIYIFLYGNLLLHHKSAISQLHLHDNLSEKDGTRKNFYMDFMSNILSMTSNISNIPVGATRINISMRFILLHNLHMIITQFTYDYNENNTLHISQATFQCKTNLYRQDINCIYINLWQRAKLQV